MKRYQINRIIDDNGNNFRSELDDVSLTHSIHFIALIPSKPDGTPKYRFAFTRFAMAGSIQPAIQLTNSYTFPDYPLDGELQGMEAGVYADMIANLGAYDLDGNGLHFVTTNSPTQSFRDFVQFIARQLEPSMDANRFEVGEPS